MSNITAHLWNIVLNKERLDAFYIYFTKLFGFILRIKKPKIATGREMYNGQESRLDTKPIEMHLDRVELLETTLY